MADSAPPNSSPALRAPRLLLVDDDVVVLRALRRMLLGLRSSWEIELAHDGRQALGLLAQRSYDVVVTDLQMPGLDGVALLEELKLKHPLVGRVVYSSHLESLGRAHLEYLAHSVADKPGQPHELVQMVDAALDQRWRVLRGLVSGES